MGIRFISDEIYHGLDYAFPAVTAARAVAERAGDQFVLEILLHDRLARRLDRGAGAAGAVRSNGCSRTCRSRCRRCRRSRPKRRSTVVHEMEDIKHGYQENRRILIAGLPNAGLTEFLPADGAFYLYADVSKFTIGQLRLRQADAGAGACRRDAGRRLRSDPRQVLYLRFSYASSTEDMQEAVARISKWLGQGGPKRGNMILPTGSHPVSEFAATIRIAERVVAKPAAKASLRARRAIVLAAFGVALLAVSAKINLPLPYVPMTLQTLVVLMIGAVYGWRLGTLTIIAYLAVGALGLPVFAGPVGGLKPLTGATAGFLSGFVVAAFVTGWFSERGWDRSMVRLFVADGHRPHRDHGHGLCVAGLRYEARRREGLVGRRHAVPGGGISEEHIGRDPGTRPARNG